MDAKFTYAQANSSWLIEILFFAHAKRFGNAMAIETIEYTRKGDVNRGFKNEIQNSGVTVRHEGRFSRPILSGQFPSRFAAICGCSILFVFSEKNSTNVYNRVFVQHRWTACVRKSRQNNGTTGTVREKAIQKTVDGWSRCLKKFRNTKFLEEITHNDDQRLFKQL